jgi:hypothetical protein
MEADILMTDEQHQAEQAKLKQQLDAEEIKKLRE